MLIASATDTGFQWDPHVVDWLRPGLSVLSNLTRPSQHSKSTILDAWREKVSADLCVLGKGFVVVPFWIVVLVLYSSSTRIMFWRELRHCYVVSWLGMFGKGFVLSRVRGQPVPCHFCCGIDGAPILLLLKSV